MSWNLDDTNTWADDKGRIDEVGCIHTAQGLELDYVGVIIGPDMIIKNTYRTLMTRGMKGCYIYSVDPETQRYFEEHLNSQIQDSTIYTNTSNFADIYFFLCVHSHKINSTTRGILFQSQLKISRAGIQT